jgi:excisionase family DNA binding protein
MERAITVTEAARRLGVSRHKVWLLMREGALPSRPNPLDRRQKLIPVEAVERLAHHGASRRPYPRTIGIVSDGSLPSGQSEEYMLSHLRQS